MKQTMSPIEINYRLLIALARCTFSQKDVETAKELLAHPDFDKGLFIASCFKQKIAGLAYWNLNRWGISRLLPWMGYALKFFYCGNMKRNERILKEARKILRHALKANLDMRPLKGTVLVPLIYEDGGSRLLSDVDFFVDRSQISATVELLATLDYIQGTPDRQKNIIVPLSRENKLLWQLKMFETPPFLKMVDDEYLSFGGVFSVDVSFGLSFSDNREISSLVLAQSANIAGFKTLSTIDFFIQLCAHLYKEASNKSWIDIDLDINLIKFCDVREYTLRSMNLAMASAIKDRIETLSAQKAVYFSLRLVHDIYEDVLVADLIKALEFEFSDYEFMTAIYQQNSRIVGVRQRSVAEAIASL